MEFTIISYSVRRYEFYFSVFHLLFVLLTTHSILSNIYYLLRVKNTIFQHLKLAHKNSSIASFSFTFISYFMLMFDFSDSFRLLHYLWILFSSAHTIHRSCSLLTLLKKTYGKMYKICINRLLLENNHLYESLLGR